VGNVPELLDFEDRLLAASKDSEKLAKGVKFIHDNPGIVKQMQKKNKEKVLNFYNRELLYETYKNIYKKLLK
jgi:polysaccharide biosynthesis protein PelF